MCRRNGSSSTPPPFWWPVLVSLPSAIVGAVIASKMMGTENVKLEEVKNSTTEDIRKLSYALEKAKMTVGEIEHYVPVEAVTEVREQQQPWEQNVTVLVHGPRGVGKSTVMQVALRDVEGIVHVAPNPFDVENLYSSILLAVGVKPQDKANDMLVISALRKIKERGGTKPTFVVDVNEKCDEKRLMAVLIEMKKLVADSNLSFGFVVLSSSRAALLLPVNLDELRVDPLSISDPPPRIIMAYLEKRLSQMFPGSELEEREDWITSYIQQIGTRFLDAVNLLRTLRKPNVKKDNVKDFIEEFVSRKKEAYRSSALDFVTIVDKRKRKEILTGIMNKNLPLRELVEATGSQNKESLITTLASFHPHPVYIDVVTSLVGFGNFVSYEEFKRSI